MHRRPLLVAVLTIGLLASGTVAAAASSARPSVTSIAPTTAPLAGGTRVAVHGTGFSDVRSVTFGTARGTDVQMLSSRDVHVTAPGYHAGLTHVRVVTGKGTSSATVATRFTYFAAPSVTSLSTLQGDPAGGTAVDVYGTTFRHVQDVTFGSAVVSDVQQISTTELQVTAPTHDPGVAYLRVHTDYGTSRGTSASRFVYAQPAPDAVTGLHADPTETSVGLSWTPPADSSDNVVIRRAPGATPPASATDGDAVTTVPASADSYRDTGLTGATQYSYALFVETTGGGTSAPATITATTTADPRPAAPTDVGAFPGSEGDQLPCTTAPTFFADAYDFAVVGTIDDPDAPDPSADRLAMRVRVRDYGVHGDAAPTAVLPFSDQEGWSDSTYGPGERVSRLGWLGLQDGHVYGIDTESADSDGTTSGISRECFIRTDFSRPSTPDVTGPATGQVGQPITFQLSSTDTAPAGATASGVDHFDWTTASSGDLAGDGGTHVTASGTGATRTATITFTPTLWGTNYVYVTAVDAAGNESGTASVSFYAEPN